VRSWESKTEAKEWIGDTDAFKHRPAKIHLNIKDPKEGKGAYLGWVVASLKPTDCQDCEGIRVLRRKVADGKWTLQSPPSEGTS